MAIIVETGIEASQWGIGDGEVGLSEELHCVIKPPIGDG